MAHVHNGAACGCRSEHTHHEHGQYIAGQHNHGHGHHHGHHHEGGSGLRSRILKITCSILLSLAAYFVSRKFELSAAQSLVVYLPSYLLAGYSTLRDALRGIAGGGLWDENFLMTIATSGAMLIGFMPGAEPEFAEAVCVMVFFQVGAMFEEYAEGQSRRSIAHLLSLRPDVAHRQRDGMTEDIRPEDIGVGDILLVRPGEKIPTDGVITDGTTTLDTASLTGESMPREATAGDAVAAGCVNLSGVIRLEATCVFGESTTSRMIRIVEEAGTKKSRSEAFITRFARIYTPLVVFAAIALALIPPILSGAFTGTFAEWLHRALIFLVVSCPCALVISVPLTFFAGIGGASRQGVLVKGAGFIDRLAAVKVVCFDKTGTLTAGKFAVTAVHPERANAETIIHLAAHVERHSTHPVATALRDAFPAEASDGCPVNDIHERAGYGITAKVGQREVAVGGAKLMERLNISWKPCSHRGTIIHVAIDGLYAGHIVINDSVKDASPATIRDLHELGIRTAMLTGDNEETARQTAQATGIKEVRAGLTPEGKVACIEEMLSKKPEGSYLAFVGDGINDAPVLSMADVGIAMGGIGAEAAIEAADVVVMNDNPHKVVTAIAHSKRTLGIARQNIGFAIGVKGLVLLLASVGLATMWMAVFADVGVTVLAVFNAMRALKSGGQSRPPQKSASACEDGGEA